MSVRGWFARGPASLLIGVLLLTACAGGTTTPPPTAPAEPDATAPVLPAPTEAPAGEGGDPALVNPLPPVDPAEVTAPISIGGSSTMFPLTAAVVDDFRQAGSLAPINVNISGTVAGFRNFCDEEGTEIDIVNASRAMLPVEQAGCNAAGREAVGFEVAVDAIVVAVSEDNEFLEELDFAQLEQIFSGAVQSWDQIDPSYPALPIALYSPGPDSGTFDFFVDQVLNRDPRSLLDAPDVVLSEDDLLLVQGVASNPNAIGFFGYSFYQSNRADLRALALSDGEGDVIAPMPETISNETYPMARPLFIYSSPVIMREKPHVAGFINYYLQSVDDIVTDVGYFPASEEVLVTSRQRFLNALP